MWIADAHRHDGKRYVVRADEKLTAFVELESVIRPLRINLHRESQSQEPPIRKIPI